MHKFANLGRNNEDEDDDFEVEEKDYNFTSLLNKNAAQNRRIYLWGDVNEESAISVISQLHFFAEENRKPIHIIIHSCGGEVDAELSIIDEMVAVQNAGVTVSTVVTGKAYSAAALILIMGTVGHRYGRPNSSIMLHPVSYGLGQDYSDYQEKMTAFIKTKNKVINDMIGKKIGLKTDKQIKKFVSDMDKGLWLNAEEAVERKIIDKILDTELPNNKGKESVKNNSKRRVRASVSK